MKAYKRIGGKSDKSIPKFSRLQDGRLSAQSNLNIDTELLIPGILKNEMKSPKNFKFLSNHPAFKGLKSCTPKQGSRLNGFLGSGNDIGQAIKTTRSKELSFKFLNSSSK
jgi:hypothetical protein